MQISAKSILYYGTCLTLFLALTYPLLQQRLWSNIERSRLNVHAYNSLLSQAIPGLALPGQTVGCPGPDTSQGPDGQGGCGGLSHVSLGVYLESVRDSFLPCTDSKRTSCSSHRLMFPSLSLWGCYRAVCNTRYLKYSTQSTYSSHLKCEEMGLMGSCIRRG